MTPMKNIQAAILLLSLCAPLAALHAADGAKSLQREEHQ